ERLRALPVSILLRMLSERQTTMVSPAEQVKIDRVYTEYYNVCLEKTAEYQGHTKADTSLADLKKELVLAKVGKLEEKERLVGEEWRKLEAELAKPI
ncbi:4710_t:CDS:2, partial [Funneliformis geosporum]